MSIDEKAFRAAIEAYNKRCTFGFDHAPRVCMRDALEAYEAAKAVQPVECSTHSYGRTDGYGGSTCQKCGHYKEREHAQLVGSTYECHLTLECPSGSPDLVRLEELGRLHKWKTSVIHGDPQLGNKDFFYFTRHAGSFAEMKGHMIGMERMLTGCGETIIRKKIEHIIFDTKTGIDCQPTERESVEALLADMHSKGFDGHVSQTDKGCCANFTSRNKPYIIGRCGFESTPIAALLAAKNDTEIEGQEEK